MWNVEERFSPKAIESLAALGFAVGSTRGVVRVEKYGCGAEFRKGTDDLYQMTIIPTIMLKGQFTKLWDAGYQKFLLTDEGQKLPALASHLQNLRKFNEELRTALGVPTFYNEALGSVSQISVYDRVKGRKGDVPDTTVGAHPSGSCINTGTVPSKTLRESALYFSGLQQRGLHGIDYSLKENLTIQDFMHHEREVVEMERARILKNLELHKIEFIRGQASFED